ncbi:MAG: hypothetical protein ACR2NW_05955 [Thermodesulfobacteriota bacterium]
MPSNFLVMPKKLPELERILGECSELLGKAAQIIRESELDSIRDNIHRTAYALRNINEIRLQVYKLDPNLKPEFLNENLKDPETNKIFANVIMEAEDLCKDGKFPEAIRLYEEYLTATPPEFFLKLASAEIKRIKSFYS